MTLNELVCCCRRIDCEALTANNLVIGALKTDVLEAGTLGQVLLTRHEQYVAQAEKDRMRLLETMTTLRGEKAALEVANARIVKENRALLDQLEDLNTAVTESDTHIESLSQTLDSTRHELSKLSSLAHKAAQLELELNVLEAERMRLDSELITSKADETSATQRWRKAEAAMSHLQKQMEEMETSSTCYNSQNLHSLIRSSAPASTRSSRNVGSHQQNRSGHNLHGEQGVPQAGTLSYFVKDILQDNSNLQVENLELRDMLLASNNELKNLRTDPSGDSATFTGHKSLGLEMQTVVSSDRKPESISELHVHHHYHQKTSWRRSRRRRSSMLSVQSRRDVESPRLLTWNESEIMAKQLPPVLESEASVTNAGRALKHQPNLSTYSSASGSSYAPSSLSVSPRCLSTIFDTFDHNLYSSTSSTPISSAPGSPRSDTRLPHDHGVVLRSRAVRPLSPSLKDDGMCSLPSIPAEFAAAAAAEEEGEEEEEEEEAALDADTRTSFPAFGPRIRRVRSQDSLLSVSGMDIHTSGILKRSPGAMPAYISRSVARPQPHAAPTLTAATATSSASSVSSLQGHGVSQHLLEHHHIPSSANRAHSPLIKINSWVFGKRRPTTLHTVPIQPQEDAACTAASETPFIQSFRSPGINQPGPIFGLLAPQPAPVDIQPQKVDTDLLRESLEGK